MHREQREHRGGGRTQARAPATRRPVSSKLTTGAARSPTAIRSSTPHCCTSDAARATIAAIVPVEIGSANSSANTCAQRDWDRNCPAVRYVASAATFGPYCTGAATPAGTGGAARHPQAHRTVISWCSVTSTTICGTSNTWRRSIATTSVPDKSAPQPEHSLATCGQIRFGSATIANVPPP
jgi:hypothetical protein